MQRNRTPRFTYGHGTMASSQPSLNGSRPSNPQTTPTRSSNPGGRSAHEGISYLTIPKQRTARSEAYDPIRLQDVRANAGASPSAKTNTHGIPRRQCICATSNSAPTQTSATSACPPAETIKAHRTTRRPTGQVRDSQTRADLLDNKVRWRKCSLLVALGSIPEGSPHANAATTPRSARVLAMRTDPVNSRNRDVDIARYRRERDCGIGGSSWRRERRSGECSASLNSSELEPLLIKLDPSKPPLLAIVNRVRFLGRSRSFPFLPRGERHATGSQICVGVGAPSSPTRCRTGSSLARAVPRHLQSFGPAASGTFLGLKHLSTAAPRRCLNQPNSMRHRAEPPKRPANKLSDLRAALLPRGERPTHGLQSYVGIGATVAARASVYFELLVALVSRELSAYLRIASLILTSKLDCIWATPNRQRDLDAHDEINARCPRLGVALRDRRVRELNAAPNRQSAAEALFIGF
uniref:Uncharacterized protein n=1 Tax=Mycena chlorophos TaxID=658473 RepID=A0ABQ0LV86_MYCCL|nr:predicted protein [Mycena chlorophos]